MFESSITVKGQTTSARAFDILMKNPFTPGDFEKFIEERGNTLRSRIKDLAGQVGL